MFNPIRQAHNLIFRRLLLDFQKAGIASQSNGVVRAKPFANLARCLASICPAGVR